MGRSRRKILSVTRGTRCREGEVCQELWTSTGLINKRKRTYDVRVSVGKPVNILSLKSQEMSDFGSRVSHLRSSRRPLFRARSTEKVCSCPVCGFTTSDSIPVFYVYGGHYHQCRKCSHCFVINRPTRKALNEFYARDVHYASTYTNKKVIRTRIEQVVVPKARWMLENYKMLFGKKPRSVLDVGAGGGHFVYACRRLGIKAYGIEPSESSRMFCRKAFGFDLENIDFVDQAKTDADIITFWGVVEHVPYPLELLRKARGLLSGKNGVVVAEVPRWDSLSTTVQRLFPRTIIRHLEPLGHIHCFTDTSLCTAFEATGFVPAAAWYFGMDAYELFTQLYFSKNRRKEIHGLKRLIDSIQGTVDRGRLSDEMVLMGKLKK